MHRETYANGFQCGDGDFLLWESKYRQIEQQANVFAASLVLLFHSIPEYVAGDWLVDTSGPATNWVFAESQFIAGIDSHFDYRHERQGKLAEIQALRQKLIRF